MDSLSRPADVFLSTWSQGHPAALDVHMISPLQQQTLGEAAFTPGYALQVGVERKLASWQVGIGRWHPSPNLHVSRSGVHPTMLGGLAEDLISILHSLGTAIAQRVGSEDHSIIYSIGLPTPCGWGMPPFGYTVSQLSPPQ